MKDRDFVQLAWTILHEHGERNEETGEVTQVYEDEYIIIDTSKSHTAIEITRKSHVDEDRPELKTEYTVTKVSACTEDRDPEIVRHHAEHAIIAPHMMYLIELSDTHNEFYLGLLENYPEIVVKQGI